MIDLEMCRIPANIQKRVGLTQEIIQIGAVCMENGEVCGRFSEYVKPRYGRISCFINRLTGIRESDVCGAQELDEVLKKLTEWAGESEAVFVSWSMTDRIQIRREMAAKDIENRRLEEAMESWEDCQELFGRTANVNRCYGLQDALQVADIDPEGTAHNALADAYNTAILYRKLKREGEKGLNSWFLEARRETEPELLRFSMGDLFAGICIGEAVGA